MFKIRKGDDVVVVAGKDKGKKGVVRMLVGDNKVIVDGVNVVKKHKKPNPNQNVPGGIEEKEMPIHLSNIGIYNPETKKADRIGIRVLEDDKKVRFFKSTNEIVDI